MSFLGPPKDSTPEPEEFSVYRERLGFVPNFLKIQSMVPRLVRAEAELARSILLRPAGLTQLQKELITVAVDAHLRSSYALTVHAKILAGLGADAETIRRLARNHRDAGLAGHDVALVDFAVKLAVHPTWLDRSDFDGLRSAGFADEQILEAVLTVAIARFVGTLSAGLGADPDFAPFEVTPDPVAEPSASGPRPAALDEDRRNFIRALEGEGAGSALAFFRERYGFVPRVFSEQAFRPDILEAEARMLEAVVHPSEALSRVRKEMILLVAAAAQLNSYFVAASTEILRQLGLPPETADRVAVDHRSAGLDAADVALLDVAAALARSPERFSAGDVAELRRHGFSDAQIVEAVTTASLALFLGTIQTALGTVPDFPVRFEFPREAPTVPTGGEKSSETVNPEGGLAHPTTGGVDDPDAGLVARVRAGEVDAFEPLVRRHGGRLLRVLTGITGNAQDAEDALQNAFLKAYERLGDFQGDARFGTWLTRIALNEGLQKVRARRPTESLDETSEDEESYRPRLILPWHENPETIYSEEERRALVAEAVAGLPEKYRVAVVLRDVEQMPTEDAAAALGLPVPTLKTRLLRGRLMLREALAPHFVARPSRRR